MFLVLDNPEDRRGILGHWFTLAIDIVGMMFRVYDSLREPGNKDLKKICTTMVKLLKHTRRIPARCSGNFSDNSIL
jgi:hypothetical protein